jgi:site-specific DNA-methyltransferase (adenine-specific)
MFNGDRPQSPSNYNDNGSASRYFYCAKASKRDRDEGLDYLSDSPMYVADNDHGNLGAYFIKMAGGEMGEVKSRKNSHPTVKPVSLMQYLVRLVTPKGGTVLDPFTGSGSTGKATMYENYDRDAGYKFIGVEMDSHYCEIANARISCAEGNPVMLPIDEEVKNGNMVSRLFDL